MYTIAYNFKTSIPSGIKTRSMRVRCGRAALRRAARSPRGVPSVLRPFVLLLVLRRLAHDQRSGPDPQQHDVVDDVEVQIRAVTELHDPRDVRRRHQVVDQIEGAEWNEPDGHPGVQTDPSAVRLADQYDAEEQEDRDEVKLEGYLGRRLGLERGAQLGGIAGLRVVEAPDVANRRHAAEADAEQAKDQTE